MCSSWALRTEKHCSGCEHWLWVQQHWVGVSILNPVFLLSWQTCLNAIGHRGQNTVVGNHFPSPGDLPNPGIEPSSPALQADSLPAEQQGKPKNTGVGNLSLLQQIFPTQESNRGLLHCRQILNQLSYRKPCDNHIYIYIYIYIYIFFFLNLVCEKKYWVGKAVRLII